MYNTGTIKVSLNHTLPISLYYSTHEVFKSHIKSSQADFNCKLPVAISYHKLNSQLFWEPHIAVARTCITENMSHDRQCCVTSLRITENTSCDPYTLLCDITAHALYSNGPSADTKKTLPQYCCVVHVLECVYRAIAWQCFEQICYNTVRMQTAYKILVLPKN
jgi:hypothetical protein